MSIAKALLAIQAEAPTLQKSAINPHFKSSYVPLDALLDKVLPILNKNGVVLLQPVTMTDGGMPALRTRLIHAESGDEYEDTMPLAVEKPTPQGQASAVTYARRNALMAMLGLAGTDDDGNGAEPNAVSQFKAPPPKRQPASEKKAKPATLKMLAETVAALQKGFPSPDPTHKYSNDVKADIKAMGKTKSDELTEEQAQSLVLKYEKQLVDLQAEAKVPF